MKRNSTQLRDDAIAIFQAGVDAVDSQRLVRDAIEVDGEQLRVAGQPLPIPLPIPNRIMVVGAGKAGAAMAAGVEQALASVLDRVDGWVNVPANCVRSLERIHLHAARPAGVNEPTEQGVAGSREILNRVRQLDEHDLCICLISGGGSALLPLPQDGVTLEDKQSLTRFLSAAGANIAELNTVRKQLSQIKGGGLARECRAGQLVTLIISDVIGDPLDVIASGPTVPDSSTPTQALQILEKYDAAKSGARSAVWEFLQSRNNEPAEEIRCQTLEHVIGNNATAAQAAAEEARRRGYRVRCEPAEQLEGDVTEVATAFTERALAMHDGSSDFDCLITGGEPTVTLAPAAERGKGGRNQQLVAVAMKRLLGETPTASQVPSSIALLSGGTDGEDGPTDAAGAWAANTFGDFSIAELEQAIQRNDTYHFFEKLDALIKTGPTHTNVCDLRVAVVQRQSAGS